MSKFRVWWHEEFVEHRNNPEWLERVSWEVPDTKSILYPERPGIPCDDVRDAAEQYADYFHSHRDGYENTWPVKFVVHDGDRYYLVEVEREFSPEFSASKPSELQP